jgi:hypothetical protein
MSTRHPCERCGTRFRRRTRGDSLLCPSCRERRDHTSTLAYGRARTWLAEQHPKLYRDLYEQHVAQARAQDPAALATTIRNRARSRTLGELARRFEHDYRQRHAAELARADDELAQAAATVEEPAPPECQVPYWQQRDALAQRSARANATARLRALLWLADRYPDATAALYQDQAVRLPLNPANRTPERRRALAWAATLDRLGRLHPAEFEARYRTELAGMAEVQRRSDGDSSNVLATTPRSSPGSPAPTTVTRARSI